MEALLKVEGGKMLRVRGEVSGGRISSIMITGDFFLHPEEAIESLETSLKGALLERDTVLAIISDGLAGAILVGATEVDVTDLVMMLSE